MLWLAYVASGRVGDPAIEGQRGESVAREAATPSLAESEESGRQVSAPVRVPAGAGSSKSTGDSGLQAARRHIVIRVEDQMSRGVSGAEIVMSKHAEVGADAMQKVQARTGPDGCVSFEAPLDIGTFVAARNAKGRSSFKALTALPSHEEAVLQLLEDDFLLLGEVVDGFGRGVPNATVDIWEGRAFRSMQVPRRQAWPAIGGRWRVALMVDSKCACAANAAPTMRSPGVWGAPACGTSCRWMTSTVGSSSPWPFRAERRCRAWSWTSWGTRRLTAKCLSPRSRRAIRACLPAPMRRVSSQPGSSRGAIAP